MISCLACIRACAAADFGWRQDIVVAGFVNKTTGIPCGASSQKRDSDTWHA
jgi:hypothetical protein